MSTDLNVLYLKTFLFGASSLANDILMQLQKEHDGHYQSADYFSLD